MRRRLRGDSTHIGRLPVWLLGGAAPSTRRLGSRWALDVLVGAGFDELHEMFKFTEEL